MGQFNSLTIKIINRIRWHFGLGFCYSLHRIWFTSRSSVELFCLFVCFFFWFGLAFIFCWMVCVWYIVISGFGRIGRFKNLPKIERCFLHSLDWKRLPNRRELIFFGLCFIFHIVIVIVCLSLRRRQKPKLNRQR